MKITPNKRPRLSFGFQTAASLMEESGAASASVLEEEQEETVSATVVTCTKGSNVRDSSDSSDVLLLNISNDVTTSTEITLDVVGCQHYQQQHSSTDPESTAPPLLLEVGTELTFRREPNNAYDPNAIAVFYYNKSSNANNDSSLVCTGHIRKATAALLAPHLDNGSIVLGANDNDTATATDNAIATVRQCHSKGEAVWVSVSVQARYSNDTPFVGALLGRWTRKVKVQTGNGRSSRNSNYLQAIRNSDVERSKAAPFFLSQYMSLPWNPVPQWKEQQQQRLNNVNSNLLHPQVLPWGPAFDESLLRSNNKLSLDEIQQAGTAQWPPSDSFLVALGMAPSSNTAWWRDTAGLAPPNQWKVQGPHDLLQSAAVVTVSTTQRKAAVDTLGGALHGVTDVWLPETLLQLDTLMHEPAFWCVRSKDALIRAFGGPYVLGQDAEKLKLVHGAPHTALTQKMCNAHNLVYTATHLMHPAQPGFNTLIFGANLAGAGFHYHQDSIGDLKAKNAPLVAKQPVVTTVLYDKPVDDQGKELVLWKPILNFTPQRSSSAAVNAAVVVGKNKGNVPATGSEYLAAVALPTMHGMIHVQRAGIQSKALHGIFHNPGTTARVSFRVAVTARITKPNAAQLVDVFQKQGVYMKEYGPAGELQLPRTDSN